MGSGVAGVRDGQSDAALEAPRQDSAAALICAADASAGIIQPSDYDQSCAFDSDCVEVHVTSACSCDLFCVEPPQAINKGTLPQYTADFAKLPRLLCNCTNPLPPCDADEPFGPHCVGGMCQIASPCSDWAARCAGASLTRRNARDAAQAVEGGERRAAGRHFRR
jgi:hypothetical protein